MEFSAKQIAEFIHGKIEGGESNGKLSNIIKGNRNIMRAFRKNGIQVSMFYPVRRLLPKVIDRLRNTLHS